MSFRFLLDEHYRGILWRAVQGHNARGVHAIDVVRVGDLPDLPLGSKDPDILIWAEREGRVVVTRDRKTMATHLARHLQAGRISPAVLFVRRRSALPLIVGALVLYAYAGDQLALQNRIEYIP
jgi:hypothetical protein